MSCCSSGYCNFNFPEGPPLTDLPVTNLQAKYLFLPYGTLLSQGEVIRIWMENGQTRVVSIKEKVFVDFSGWEPVLVDYDLFVAWDLVALDSGMDVNDIKNWKYHELYNSDTIPVILIFDQFEDPKCTLWQTLRHWLYKIRTL